MKDMAAMDFNPAKEIRGITLRSIAQFVILLIAGIYSFSTIQNSLSNLLQASTEQKADAKEQRQQTEVQYKIIQNRLSEQEVRLVKLEAEMKLYQPIPK